MKTYYFIFSKTDLLLQRTPDGGHTIPCCNNVPVKIHPWTHIMNVTPEEDGTEVKTFKIDSPDHLPMRLWLVRATTLRGFANRFITLPNRFI